MIELIGMSEGHDCFRVEINQHGEKATYARFPFRAGERVYTVQGEACNQRTRDSIEVGPGQHVVDRYALFINHSFTPNLRVRGRDFVAISEIEVGDEVTFNYLESESAIAAPFTCHDTGKAVSSAECLGNGAGERTTSNEQPDLVPPCPAPTQP